MRPFELSLEMDGIAVPQANRSKKPSRPGNYNGFYRLGSQIVFSYSNGVSKKPERMTERPNVRVAWSE